MGILEVGTLVVEGNLVEVGNLVVAGVGNLAVAVVGNLLDQEEGSQAVGDNPVI